MILEIGKTYRAKKPRRYGAGHYNGRTIIQMVREAVQYDGPAVLDGRRYPIVTLARFLTWASHEVSDGPV